MRKGTWLNSAVAAVPDAHRTTQSSLMAVSSVYPTMTLQPRQRAWPRTSCRISCHQLSRVTPPSSSSHSSSSFTDRQLTRPPDHGMGGRFYERFGLGFGGNSETKVPNVPMRWRNPGGNVLSVMKGYSMKRRSSRGRTETEWRSPDAKGPPPTFRGDGISTARSGSQNDRSSISGSNPFGPPAFRPSDPYPFRNRTRATPA